MHDIYSMMPQRWHEIHVSHRSNHNIHIYVCIWCATVLLKWGVYAFLSLLVRSLCLPVIVIHCRSLVEKHWHVTQLLIIYLEVYYFHSSNPNWLQVIGFSHSSLLKKNSSDRLKCYYCLPYFTVKELFYELFMLFCLYFFMKLSKFM
jgi:hypothetical protein